MDGFLEKEMAAALATDDAKEPRLAKEKARASTADTLFLPIAMLRPCMWGVVWWGAVRWGASGSGMLCEWGAVQCNRVRCLRGLRCGWVRCCAVWCA